MALDKNEFAVIKLTKNEKVIFVYRLKSQICEFCQIYSN
jgi:hypothetical protein